MVAEAVTPVEVVASTEAVAASTEAVEAIMAAGWAVDRCAAAPKEFAVVLVAAGDLLVEAAEGVPARVAWEPDGMAHRREVIHRIFLRRSMTGSGIRLPTLEPRHG
jgi:hypothetical protein